MKTFGLVLIAGLISGIAQAQENVHSTIVNEKNGAELRLIILNANGAELNAESQLAFQYVSPVRKQRRTGEVFRNVYQLANEVAYSELQEEQQKRIREYLSTPFLGDQIALMSFSTLALTEEVLFDQSKKTLVRKMVRDQGRTKTVREARFNRALTALGAKVSRSGARVIKGGFGVRQEPVSP